MNLSTLSRPSSPKPSNINPTTSITAGFLFPTGNPAWSSRPTRVVSEGVRRGWMPGIYRKVYAECVRTRSLNHSTYQHEYHLVWGTKYRRKYLVPVVKEAFLDLTFHLVKKYPNWHLITINTDRDHVHLQMEIPPNISVSSVVQKIKAHTSPRLKKKFKFIREIYLEESVWSVGYFSSTIGLNEEQIRQYIQYQGRRDYSRQIRFVFSRGVGNPGWSET